MPSAQRPFSHRLLRVARDLRVSAALLVLWLIPPAVHARGPITTGGGAVGREHDDTAERARDRAARAYIIHLPGIAGPMRFDSRFGEGLVVGQAGSEVEIFDWVGKRRGLLALYGVEENRRQARKLADRIIELKASQPDRALVITAHSGGTAVVAWALEMLGEAAEAAPEATERRSDEATRGSETSRDREGAVSGAAETTRSSKAGSDPQRHGVPPADPQAAPESAQEPHHRTPAAQPPGQGTASGSETSRDHEGAVSGDESETEPRAGASSGADSAPPAQGRGSIERAPVGAVQAGSLADSPATSTDARKPPDSREGSAHAHNSPPLVDGVIFIASGLSSDYDLAPMLRQVRGRVFHLSSVHDNLILAAGTAVFGTLDRKNGLAAGKTGFYLPAGVAPEAYERFVEVPYDRAWAEYGHYGDHEGMMTTSFAAKVAADLVRASVGVEVELPTTRPAKPSPPKPATAAVDAKADEPAPEAAGRE